MSATSRRICAITLMSVVLLALWVGVAVAAPRLGVGVGYTGGHSSNPGLCTGCHSFTVWPAPAITQGEVATHGNRGSTCTGCHVVNPVVPTVPVTWMKGASRYETAVKVSQSLCPTGAPAVVLATGADFPDALCAAPLASAHRGPILLVAPKASLDAAVLAEINRLRPATVFIIGSVSAVPSGIEAQVKALSWGPSVTRIAGSNRFATAALVAAAVKAKLGTVTKVVVASGTTYPDALAVAPLAAAKGWPILLTTKTALPPQTADAVVRLGATSTLVVGGTAGVSADVALQLPNVVRTGGTDRYATCGLIADYAASQGMSYAYLGTTVGNNFPDALAAGPLFAARKGVLMLTPPTSVAPAVASRMSANKATVDNLIVIGGAVQQSTVNSMSGMLN